MRKQALGERKKVASSLKTIDIDTVPETLEELYGIFRERHERIAKVRTGQFPAKNDTASSSRQETVDSQNPTSTKEKRPRRRSGRGKKGHKRSEDASSGVKTSKLRLRPASESAGDAEDSISTGPPKPSIEANTVEEEIHDLEEPVARPLIKKDTVEESPDDQAPTTVAEAVETKTGHAPLTTRPLIMVDTTARYRELQAAAMEAGSKTTNPSSAPLLGPLIVDGSAGRSEKRAAMQAMAWQIPTSSHGPQRFQGGFHADYSGQQYLYQGFPMLPDSSYDAYQQQWPMYRYNTGPTLPVVWNAHPGSGSWEYDPRGLGITGSPTCTMAASDGTKRFRPRRIDACK